MSTAYYHGGPRGLRKILPSAETGARSHAADLSRVCRRDRVYVTSEFAAAILYAAAFEKGAVYEVRPLGDLIADPDCAADGLSWECAAAEIIRVHKPTGKLLRTARKALLA